MDVDSLLSYLERQKELSEGLPYPEKKQKKLLKELKRDKKRLKSDDPKALEEITAKYFKTKPRIAELKRILCDCVFKLLSYFKYGNEAMWYDRKCGASLMRRMWDDFGCKYKRPEPADIVSYRAEYSKSRVSWGCDLPYQAQSKPKLIEELMVVLEQLEKVMGCGGDGDSAALLEADATLNATVDQVWNAWNRDRSDLASPHTDSYDYFLTEGMHASIRDINNMREYVVAGDDSGATIQSRILPETIKIEKPEVTPQQARTRCLHYSGRVTCRVAVSSIIDGKEQPVNLAEYMACQSRDKIMRMNNWLETNGFVPKGSAKKATELLWTEAEFPMLLGEVPIMVGSSHCIMRDMTREQKVAIDEDEDEIGGYFIANGNERILRMMVNSRVNYPHVIQRNSFKSRASMLSDKAVVIRSCRPNGVYFVNSVLYEDTGAAIFSFLRGRHWLLPACQLMMALKPVSFHDLYQLFLPPERQEADQLAAESSRERAANNVRIAWKLHRSQSDKNGNFDWTEFLGSYFKENRICQRWLPNKGNESASYIGEYMIRRHVLPHLNDDGPLIPGSHSAEKERKFYYLAHCIHKLFDYQDGFVGPDSADHTSHQQVIPPGEVMSTMCHQGVNGLYREFEAKIVRNAKATVAAEPTHDYLASKMWDIIGSFNRNLFVQCQYLITTGNFAPGQNRPFGIMQASGLSVVAERINIYRLMSQIRSVHRGAQVQEMRSSVARKLPLEAWGYICPVETPDGAPCGVLNHLSASCVVTTNPEDPTQARSSILEALSYRNMRAVQLCPPQEARRLAPVTLNGEVLGYVDRHKLLDTEDDNIGTWLRSMKTKAFAASLGLEPVPAMLEICSIPFPTDITNEAQRIKLEQQGILGLYPGLLLFTTAGRLMRPVKSLVTGGLEYLGALEQVYLHIACTGSDLLDLPRPEDRKLYRHIEMGPVAILSFVSSMIPFFSHNPSPRNLFQCQMAKQTMGVANTSIRQRFDGKAYELRTPQRPLIRTEQHWGWGMDSHPITTNTIVAIVSYAEYDMEDAVVVNKGALERGMFEADVIKSWPLDLNLELKKSGKAWDANTATMYRCFRKRPEGSFKKTDQEDICDERGLPKKGAELRYGQTYFECCEAHHTLNTDAMPKSADEPSQEEEEGGDDPMSEDDEDKPLKPKAKKGAKAEEAAAATSEMPRVAPSLKEYVNFKPGRYNKIERCFVEAVEPIEITPDGDILSVMIRARLIRDPVLGDKFSSRHGQKGTMSLMMPSTDMPFSDSGMIPDLLINPHAFPSRMTVGMMLELVAGKLGASEGRFIVQEGSAWSAANTNKLTHELIGEQLAKLGYDYYGDETLYSGQTGEELTARIFMGCCAYQRLRHMVMDKWQCREKTGPVDITTLQPIKGRKRGGGIKVGEMERDALLSHGCVNLVMDRLFSHGLNYVPTCVVCGAFITMERTAISIGAGWDEDQEGADAATQEQIKCSQCGSDDYRMVGLPFAFIYLCAELLTLNIEVCLNLKDVQ